jgi:CheY-like chemotaxis protein
MDFSLISSTTANIDNKVISLVDDEKDILNLFCECLQNCGYQAISFDNPLEALDYIENDNNISNCSLIITDYKMPQMNGIEFIKRIRGKFYNYKCYNSNSNSQLKIMLISAFMKNDLDSHNELNSLKIEKPIRLELFKEEVQKLMKHQQQDIPSLNLTK